MNLAYLAGLATLPMVTALAYSAYRTWRWAKHCGLSEYLALRILGATPHAPVDRARWSIEVARSRRIWGIDLPGRMSVMLISTAPAVMEFSPAAAEIDRATRCLAASLVTLGHGIEPRRAGE